MEEGEIEEVEATSSKNDERRERRQRKKMLLNDVMQQLEFYFSSVNLRKDLFMQELLAKRPYIDLAVFRKFNKLRALTTDLTIMQKAIRKSSLLELSEDGMGVRRATPMEQKENEEDCTIYVENLPPIVSHEWVRKVFEQYGVIDYVSLPCFKNTGRTKGFAFIEFHTIAEAQQALQAFEALTPFDKPLHPSDLLSIKTYGQEDQLGLTTANSKPFNDSQPNSYGKKRSHADAFQEEEPTSDNNTSPQKDEGKSNPSSKKSKKKKRKRSKKEKQYENGSFLRVMSKRQWKMLRNQYLDMQRLNMGHLKALNQNLAGMHHDGQNFEDKPQDGAAKLSTKPEFSPGLIVNMTLDEPPYNPSTFCKAIKTTNISVAYIDIQNLNVYIRFKSSETAQDYVERNSRENLRVLSGKEESDYWDRLIFTWEQKRLQKKEKKPLDVKQIQNAKGRHKIIRKALKYTDDPAATHQAMYLND